MISQPRGDKVTWDLVLAHRSPEDRRAVEGRFAESDVSPEEVKSVLDDGGDALYAAWSNGAYEWTEQFGGPLSVALLAAEVGALAAHLNSRASAIRARAVEVLLDDLSAVSVAAHLGISRQKVYEIARGTSDRPYIETAPWRQK